MCAQKGLIGVCIFDRKHLHILPAKKQQRQMYNIWTANAFKQWYPCPGVNPNINIKGNCSQKHQCNNVRPCSSQVHSIQTFNIFIQVEVVVCTCDARIKTLREREQYLLFPLFVPLECGGAPCLLSLVLQELCSSLFLFEHVELVVQRLLLLLQFLFLVLVELLQTVKLLMQLCGSDRGNSSFVLVKT